MKITVFIILIAAAASTVFSQTKELAVADVKKAFEKAELSMTELVEYDDETDPNDQIGRPNGYIAKISWYDSRMEKVSETPDCTVEVFKSVKDLELRKRHIDQMYEAMPILSSYLFIHKNLILRLPKDLTPKQAAEYEKALKSL